MKATDPEFAHLRGLASLSHTPGNLTGGASHMQYNRTQAFTVEHDGRPKEMHTFIIIYDFR